MPELSCNEYPYEMGMSPLIKMLCDGPSYMYTEKCIPEMKTPPLLSTLRMVPATQKSVQNYP